MLIAGMLALLVSPSLSQTPADNADPEDVLKAATVLAFLQNSKWPDDPGGDQNLTVGVLGRPAFVQVLRRNIDGKSVNGRTVRVVALTPPIDPRCCRVYYLATDRKPEIDRALTGAAAAHVLSIGEADHFLDNGGAVNMFLVDGHMAFEVSMAALEQCGVTISSKLLRFGRVRDLKKAKAPG
jgi:hypothetical protein